MNAVFKKMQFKTHDRILVVNNPTEFQPHLEEMGEITVIDFEPISTQRYEFVLMFVKSCADIAEAADMLSAILAEDGLLWFAYPKKSSKKYTSDISRDAGWQPVGDAGFEGVRQVAIDADWSALRFRQAQFIKTMKRNPAMAMSEAGKKRVGE